jgi:SAM-dependent methyltransferase
MEFTGERYVPGTQELEDLYIEHISRYLFTRRLAGGRCVLDIGSGCGYGTYELAAGGAELVLGIDKSVEAVEFSRRNYSHPNLSFAVMDAARLSLKGRFDLVTCFELIEHVEDADSVLEGVSRVLDESGVFIVSTPNKATYVAGGEDGKNPFHVREYYRAEFENLLGSTFRAVRLLEQRWVEGMAFSANPAPAILTDARAVGLPEDPSRNSGSAAGAGSLQAPVPVAEAPYFIALCGNQEILDDVILGLESLAFYRRAPRYEALKAAARKLEQEFDRRGEWAQGLEKECRAKDRAIRDLRCELAELRSEFDERGRWARRLNAELRQSGAMVERLAAENRRLREGLAGRGQEAGTKVKT